KEIDDALGPEAAEIFNRFYGVESGGNAPVGSDPQGEFEGRNTLIERYAVEEVARICKKTADEVRQSIIDSKKKLFEIRSKRPRPHLDDKIITAWNGLMISAFARAAQVLDEKQYLRCATDAATFVRSRLFDADRGTLIRSYRDGASDVSGFADDYAFLIQ